MQRANELRAEFEAWEEQSPAYSSWDVRHRSLLREWLPPSRTMVHPEHRPPRAPSTRERTRQQSFNRGTNTLSPPAEQRLQQSLLRWEEQSPAYSSWDVRHRSLLREWLLPSRTMVHVEHRPLRAPSTRERTRQQSFNRGTNTLSPPAEQRLQQSINRLQLYGYDGTQRTAAARERTRPESLNRGNNTLSPPAPRSNDNLAEITTREQPLQESNSVGSQPEHRPPRAPSTRERTRQQSFNRGTNTLSPPAEQRLQQSISRLQQYGYEVTQRTAAARERTRPESFNTLSPPAPRSNDNLAEITASEQRLQESNNVGSQVEHRPPQAPSTRERAIRRLQHYEVMQRMAAARERRRQQSFNRENNTLPHPAPSSGVSQATIGKLRCYEHTQEMAAERKDDTLTCSICLGDVDIGQKVRVLTCEHEFHALCVDKWLLNHRTCPMCRSTVK